MIKAIGINNIYTQNNVVGIKDVIDNERVCIQVHEIDELCQALQQARAELEAEQKEQPA